MIDEHGETPRMKLPQPTPEYPTESQLRAYGDLMFLFMRIKRYERLPLRLARRCIQPPIDLNFYRVFYKDNVPRAAVTWSFLGPEQERKFVSGELLEPSDWLSGKQLWIADILAPYGRGTGGQVLKWLSKTVSEHHNIVRFLRIDDDLHIKRIVESERTEKGSWKPRSISIDQFLQRKQAATSH